MELKIPDKNSVEFLGWALGKGEIKYCKSVDCWGEDKDIGSSVSLISLRCLFQSLGQPLKQQ